jgi:hypothetical protein
VSFVRVVDFALLVKVLVNVKIVMVLADCGAEHVGEKDLLFIVEINGEMRRIKR